MQQHLQETFPEFTLILDFIHAYEYLWKAANVLYGEGNGARLAWVTDQTQLLLNNCAEQLIDRLRHLALASTSSHKQQQLNKVANYFEKNLAFMQYAMSTDVVSQDPGRVTSVPGIEAKNPLTAMASDGEPLFVAQDRGP